MKEVDNLKIALLGDIALYGKYSIENERVYENFEDIANRLKEYDHVIGNLETPFFNSSKSFGYKSAHIKSKEENIKLLKYLNIDIVNLSNNHIFDYGLAGYENTIKILEENGIKYFGVDNKQLKIDEAGVKVAFSGYCCYSTNGIGYYNTKTGKGVNVLDAFEVEKVLINNHEEGFLNIASFHVGQEHVNYPNYDHVEMARIFAEKVPYVFYGHHPHVNQGLEEVGESLIAYSLGNLCFDDVYTDKSKKPLIKQSEENKKSFILTLEICKKKIVDYDVIPLYTVNKKIQVGTDDSILKDINIYSQFLKVEKDTYIKKRSELLNEYINTRKSKRDLNWYLKRINVNSVGMIINAKKNKKKYFKCITDYISK